MRHNKKIAEIIARWVSNSSMTQTQIAKNLNISQPFLSKLLKGEYKISAERVTAIAKFLSPPNKDIAEINALIYAENDSSPDGLRQSALSLCHKAVDNIGPDAMLLHLLIAWSGFSDNQKIQIVSAALNIATLEDNNAKGKLK